MLNMDELGLSKQLLRAVKDMGFEKPMPIQESAIPFLLENERDLIGLAATGTGKTAAFGLPLLQKLDLSRRKVQALILCPTRELCRQITEELHSFCKYTEPVSIVAVYGGAPIGKQIASIRRGAHVIVATPGRIKDLQGRGVADLSEITCLVLDEADEMLNMGFEEDLREILALTPEEKQTALFSATLSKRIARIASGYLHEPHEISVGKKNAGAGNVEHSYYHVHHTDRYHALRRILDYLPNFYGIVFCRTRRSTSDVAASLAADGFGAEALHGEIAQSQRDAIMRRFKRGTAKILVATDVAARGIDVDDLTHVIHYEIPDDTASFVHRSGRTGRANNKGESIAIISPSERRKIPQLERTLQKTFVEKKVPGLQDICRNRINQMVDGIKSAGEPLIKDETLLAEIVEAFSDLDREQLIESIISTQFNEMVEYYKNATPLKDIQSRNYSSRHEFSNRGDRRRGGNNFHDNKPGHRKGDRSRRIYGGATARGGRGGYVRYFVSMGRKDGIKPKDVIGFVNQSTGNRNIPIGSIELKGSFSFFEADANFQQEIISKSNGSKFLGRTIKVEVSN